MALRCTALIVVAIPKEGADNKDIKTCLFKLTSKEGAFDEVHMHGCLAKPSRMWRGDAERKNNSDDEEGRAKGLLEGWFRHYGALKANGTVLNYSACLFGEPAGGPSLEDDVIRVVESKGVGFDVIVVAFKCEEAKPPPGMANSWHALLGGSSGSGRGGTVLERISRRAQCPVYNIYKGTTKYVKYEGPRREASDASSRGEVVNPSLELPVGRAPTPAPSLHISRSLPSGGPSSGASGQSPPAYGLVPPAAFGHLGHSAPLYQQAVPAEHPIPLSYGGQSGPPGSPVPHWVYPHMMVHPSTEASAPPFFPGHTSTPQLVPVSGGVPAGPYQGANGPFYVLNPGGIGAQPQQVYMVDSSSSRGWVHTPGPTAPAQASGSAVGHSLGSGAVPGSSRNEAQAGNSWGTTNGMANAGIARQLSFPHLGVVGEYTYEELLKITNGFNHKLGEGAYGVVYRGNSRGTEVAVKKLNPEGLQGPAEFKREVELLTALRHPNIVILMGCCPEAFCLVYELCAQGSLKERLADVDRPLSWYTRVRIALEVAAALLWMHTREMLHCDVKLDNILITDNGTAKLGDVGIAQVKYPSSKARTAALTGAFTGGRTTSTLRGSFGYVDPALFAGFLLEPSSDVYALGICILQLLTGNMAAAEVRRAVFKASVANNVAHILDKSAREWPMETVVKHLTDLGLQCTRLDQDERPDLETKVLPLLTGLNAIARAAEQADQERMRSAAASGGQENVQSAPSPDHNRMLSR